MVKPYYTIDTFSLEEMVKCGGKWTTTSCQNASWMILSDSRMYKYELIQIVKTVNDLLNQL